MRRTVVTIGALDDVTFDSFSTRHHRSDDLDEMLGIGSAEDDAYAFDDDFSAYDVPISTGLAIQEPGPVGSSSSGGAKAAGWVRGDGTYILQSGDTLSLLAKIYLAAAARYPEIWALQTAAYKAGHTVDRVNAGDVLAMPAEAVAKAKAIGVYPAPKTAPVAPPGAVAAPVAIAPKATHHLLLGGIGAAMSAGLGLLLWSDDQAAKKRPAKRRRRR